MAYCPKCGYEGFVGGCSRCGYVQTIKPELRAPNSTGQKNKNTLVSLSRSVVNGKAFTHHNPLYSHGINELHL